MDARFKVSVPSVVSLTLTLTADLSEWERLSKDLANGGPAAGEMGRKVNAMIGEAKQELSVERWTTGYATGEVEGGA